MNYEEKIKAFQNAMKEIGIKIEPVETSGGALIVVTDIETGMAIGHKIL